MKPHLILALILAIGPLARSARADDLDDLMQRVMTRADIPGAAVAVVRDGRIVRMSSFGLASLEHGAPATPQTPFQIASAGKIYTAVLLMKMVDEGRLNLDDRVDKVVPEVPPGWRTITVRNLASHMSGLSSVDLGPDSLSTADAVHLAFKARIVAKPGERASYDSFDYTLLQLILERVGQKPFADLLRDELLTPAGMHCTAFDEAETRGPQRVADNIAGRADDYRWTGAANQRRWFLYPRFAYAAGGVFSCVQDMASLLASLDRGGLLSRGALATLETPTRTADGASADFTAGLAAGTYRGRRWVGHSGGPALSDVMYFPDDHLAVVVFTNQQRLSPQLAALIADRYLPQPADAHKPGVADAGPNLTAAVRRLLEGAAAGQVDPGLFTADVRADYAAEFDDIGPVWMGLAQPLSQLVLVNETLAPDGGRERTYRAFFGDHSVRFRVRFDPAGRIAGVDGKPD